MYQGKYQKRHRGNEEAFAAAYRRPMAKVL
jgi:hypothetical protein